MVAVSLQPKGAPQRAKPSLVKPVGHLQRILGWKKKDNPEVP